MSKKRLGLALTGSYCTFDKLLLAAVRLCADYDVTPLMSENAAVRDTRFGAAADFRARLAELTGKEIIHTIQGAEPIGPKGMFDALLIAPCTGNTLAKMASGITDTCVTMAAKSQLRGGRPVVVAVSTNDGLSGSARNIAELLGRKNIFFVPFYQDDPENKPNSLASDYSQLEDAVEAALEGRQLQPLLA